MRIAQFFTWLLFMACVGSAYANNLAVGIHAGTAGLGINAYFPFSEKIALKAAASGLNMNYDTSQDDIKYDGRLTLRNMQLGVDFYPTGKHFRLSLAAFENRNNIDLDALPNYAGEIVINGKTYTAKDIASLNGKMYWPEHGVYTGIGWSNKSFNKKGFSVAFDAGLFITKPPRIHLTAICASDLQSTCEDLLADAEEEKQQLHDDVEFLRFWPVLQLGLSYQF